MAEPTDKIRRTFRFPQTVYNLFTNEAELVGMNVQDWLIMCGLAQAGRIMEQCVTADQRGELSQEGEKE